MNREEKKSVKKADKQSGGLKWLVILLLVILAVGIPLYLVNQNNWVAKVDGLKVSKTEYKYFYYSNAAEMEAANGIDAADSGAVRAFFDTRNEEGKKYSEVLRETTLQSVGEYKALIAIAKEREITLTDIEKDYFKSAIDDMVTNYYGGKRIEADKALKSYYGIDTAQYLVLNQNLYLAYQKVLGTMQSEEIANQKTLITQEEIDGAYTANPSLYDTVTVRHILFRTTDDEGASLGTETAQAMKIKADEILERLNNGEDMEALATQYSQDPSVTNNKGVFKYNKSQMYDTATDKWSTNSLAAEFSNWGLSAALNDTAVVESSFGYHVMRLEVRETPERKDADTMILDDLASLKAMEALVAILEDNRYKPVLNTKVIDGISPVIS